MTPKSVKRATPKQASNWESVCRRIDEIAATLKVPEAEVKAAKVRNRGMRPLITFITKYGQSFDWVICGDPRTMIRTLARRPISMFTGDAPTVPFRCTAPDLGEPKNGRAKGS